MEKWAELRMAVEELIEETEKLMSSEIFYSFRKALQWVLNRMSYLDEQEKRSRRGRRA